MILLLFDMSYQFYYFRASVIDEWGSQRVVGSIQYILDRKL